MDWYDIKESDVLRSNQRLQEACSRMAPIVTKDFTIYIRLAHFTLDAQPVNVRPHIHSFFEIGFANRESNIYELEGAEHEIKSSSMQAIAIPAELSHLRRTEKPGAICFAIVVDFQCASRQTMQRFIQELRNKDFVLKLNEQTFALLEEIWALSFSQYTPLLYNTLSLKTTLVLIDILKNSFPDIFIEKQETVPAGELLSIIEQQLENSLCEENIIDIIQRKCGVSKRHINRIFVKKYNMPLRQYIIGERLRLASKLLLNSNSSVKIIALNCGFWNMSYFNRQFKKAFNMTPVEYRQRG